MKFATHHPILTNSRNPVCCTSKYIIQIHVTAQVSICSLVVGAN